AIPRHARGASRSSPAAIPLASGSLEVEWEDDVAPTDEIDGARHRLPFVLRFHRPTAGRRVEVEKRTLRLGFEDDIALQVLDLHLHALQLRRLALRSEDHLHWIFVGDALNLVLFFRRHTAGDVID